jgi:hypothetical protein
VVDSGVTLLAFGNADSPGQSGEDGPGPAPGRVVLRTVPVSGVVGVVVAGFDPVGRRSGGD